MLTKLDNTKLTTAENMHHVFQKSYTVEADLLEAINFPPLQRTIENFAVCKNDFFGYFKDDTLAGIIEIKHHTSYTHVQSLVVLPFFFRQGIASQLMSFVCMHYRKKPFFVETGVKNKPAINLYKKMGFVEVKQWDTDYGIRKIRLNKG